MSEGVATRGMTALFAVVALLLIGGASRLVQIERTRGEDLRAQAARQQTASISIPAQRGDVLDTRGRVLAGSTRKPSIFMDPSSIADPEFSAYSVAPIFGLSPAELHAQILSPSNPGFVWVKREVSEQELEAFNEIRSQRGLRAFVVREEPRRDYPFGKTAAQVLGFVRESDQVGLAGIEQAYDPVLRGTDGQRSVTVDVRRRTLRTSQTDYTPPRDGASVILTLDAYVQRLAEREVASAVAEHKAQWGVGVVLDPQSGEVLAMATQPAFDPADPIPDGIEPNTPEFEAALERTRNRAISDSYEPGSIFKPFIACGAMDDGLVQLDQEFVINGPLRMFGGRRVHDTHAYGTLPMQSIISKSSNIGMGLIAERCGNERLYDYVTSLGFGEPTGIGLPGEHAGQLWPLAQWTDYSTQSISFGQEIAITPLQMVTAFSTFCNGGVLYKPRIVRGIIDAGGAVLADYSEPVFVRQVYAPEVAEAFRLGALVEVVTQGTGRHYAQLERFQVFGKTGTAQIAREDGRGYEPGAYMGSFVCGAPSNAPRVVVLVSICRPKGRSYYGGTVAGPAAVKILEQALDYMGVPAELTAVEGE